MEKEAVEPLVVPRVQRGQWQKATVSAMPALLRWSFPPATPSWSTRAMSSWSTAMRTSMPMPKQGRPQCPRSMRARSSTGASSTSACGESLEASWRRCLILRPPLSGSRPVATSAWDLHGSLHQEEHQGSRILRNETSSSTHSLRPNHVGNDTSRLCEPPSFCSWIYLWLWCDENKKMKLLEAF